MSFISAVVIFLFYLVELFKSFAWPLTILIVVIVLRKPLAQFVNELGKRATKFSAFEVSVELATMPSTRAPWSDPSIYEASNLIGGAIIETEKNNFIKRTWIGDFTTWQYLIVDIESGKRWLISRLLLFTVILQYMYGLKCVVFVETKGEHRNRLLGIAEPKGVRLALARRYPWLEQALISAWPRNNLPVLPEALTEDNFIYIVEEFITAVQITGSTPPVKQHEWVKTAEEQVWEHANWLTLARIDEDLRGIFYDRDNSQFEDSPDTSAMRRTEAVLRRQSPFIAFVNNKGEFKGLIDRQVFLDKIGVRLVEDA